MSTREARARATAKYDLANTKQFKMKLNKTTDSDILGKLEGMANKQGYIKRLIREDIARENEERKRDGK